MFEVVPLFCTQDSHIHSLTHCHLMDRPKPTSVENILKRAEGRPTCRTR